MKEFYKDNPQKLDKSDFWGLLYKMKILFP